jgi:fumarylacetoacetate (FAA) hydrolase family protein
MSDLLDRPDRLEIAIESTERKSWALTDPTIVLLPPLDLQVIKAAGVTFALSMVERVIEERAAGDPTKAAEIRLQIEAAVGGAISGIVPGSSEAENVKRILISEGLWSQYLEVGIGPDPEIFTKAPVLSSVGSGDHIGVLARSTWNNPEPELVLAVNSTGQAVGATLGNDVNLRDFEGRSALLLTEAKDNNASCAIGPMLRLFDATFTLDTVADMTITLTVRGNEGFEMIGTSSTSQMSRRLDELINHAFGPHHRYPDGFFLFTGTLFAPTQDREESGMGFTHHVGDIVEIASPSLGRLINTVETAESAADWEFGIRDLIGSLARRGLLDSYGERD